MPSKRPDGRAPFLSTDDIVRRLRATQPAALGPWQRRLGGLTVAIGLGTVSAWLWHNPIDFHRQPPAVHGEQAAPAEAVAPTAVAPAAVASAVDVPTVPVGANVDPPAADLGTVHVKVIGAATAVSIIVDGFPVASAREWAGELPRGHHVLVVRGRHGEQSYGLQLQGTAQEVTFDLKRHRTFSRGLSGGTPRKGRW